MTFVKDFDGNSVELKIGDCVFFKCDIEQYATVVGINGRRIALENKSGFDGEYIGGQTETTEDAQFLTFVERR